MIITIHNKLPKNATVFRGVILALILIIAPFLLQAQHSIARQWNEQLLFSIRNDFARPTVHARNLWHTSIAMYDLWAVFDETAEPYFLGNEIQGFTCPFNGFQSMESDDISRSKAISYANYQLLKYRFKFSPGYFDILTSIDGQMDTLGYDKTFTSTDYSTGDARALGNYLADQLINFGRQDGSNEDADFTNLYYKPVNNPLVIKLPGNTTMSEPNRWQPLTLDLFIDQAGNPIPFDTPEFLGPEWGNVVPFSLTEDDLTIYRRDSNDYYVFHDPLGPPLLNESDPTLSDEYQWNFSLVAKWSSHLDPADSVMIDISPGALGNVSLNRLPENILGLRNFYNEEEGGDFSQGHEINPITGAPYVPQIVPRGDYTRVLAEYWADGPDSETPPGHWFTLVNYISDHPLIVKKYKGEGAILEDLEWDVKTYFILGSAMHDAAIASWAIKGWYDYPRPVSAIRYMAEQGQSSDSTALNYHPNGLPLKSGYIEIINENDPLVGDNHEFLGEIKLYAWRGPDFIENPRSDVAGVGWIRAKEWWPYQRPSFVSPPFGGYISGHSTFSRAAAETLTYITGSPYFPGGIGEFVAPKNEFLVFEDGPSQDIILQWATYRDAADQTSLSRIWGGIHPPADDMPGRLIGIKIAEDVIRKAESFFGNITTSTNNLIIDNLSQVYPNPIHSDQILTIKSNQKDRQITNIQLYNQEGTQLRHQDILSHDESINMDLKELQLLPGSYFLRIAYTFEIESFKLVVIK